MIYEAGMYYDSLQTVLGYDSIYMLKVLEIRPSYYAEQAIDLCAGSGTFHFRGKEYSENGIFFDTIPTVNGCDSIYKITVRVHPSYHIYERYDEYEYREICRDGDSFLWHEFTVRKAGEYVDTMRTTFGCDSICHLIVNFNRYEIQLYDTICDGDTLLWEGYEITRGDTLYTRRRAGQNDCDSILKLQVTMYHPFMSDGYDTICESRLLAGEQYLWGEHNSHNLFHNWYYFQNFAQN